MATGSETAACHAYQVFYDEQSRGKLDSGFIPLDNLANPKPDWREYWPIRNFLLERLSTLDADAYYGFFSPEFGRKTGLSAQSVLQFVADQKSNPDVVSFSPYFDLMALTLNAYEQGEAVHQGLISISQEFFDAVQPGHRLAGLVGHSGNTVYCNYFVAKPRFWAAWLYYNEKLFALCEAGDTPLARQFNANAKYGNSECPIKVFVMERTVSLLLAYSQFSSVAYNPIPLPRSPGKTALVDENRLLCADALKRAFSATSRTEYLDAYSKLRQEAFNSVVAPAGR